MAKKKLGALATAMSEKVFLGPEPMWQGVAATSDLISYYNWCGYKYELKVAKKATVDYLRKAGADPELIRGFDSLPDYEFMTIGWNARLILMNDARKLPPSVIARFKKKLETMHGKINVSEVKERVVIPFRRQIDDKTSRCLELYEEVFDQVTNTYTFDEEMLPHKDLISRKATEIYLPRLTKIIAEIDLAISGKDPEITEGYSGYKKNNLKTMSWSMSEYKKSLEVFLNIEEPKAVKIRKARIKRPKPPEKQIKKLKYAMKDDKYSLQSVNPHKIVGAAELWLFNVEYRKLTVLRAIDRGGLSVKGSTIYGFDEKSSGTKRVRKPEEVLKEVTTGGKVSARKAFEALRTELYPAKGRINEDVILLRVFN